jgi:hypothetical protein
MWDLGTDPTGDEGRRVYFYASESTVAFLNSSQTRVYLYGSGEGYSNFGDTIQLKGTVEFYRNNTAMTPIVVLALSSVNDERHARDLAKWYGVDHVMFTSTEALDAKLVGLEAMTSISTGGYLHLYGGGYLNGIWGKARLDFVEFFLKVFLIEKYLISGVQIDGEIIPQLNRVFEIKQPELFGVRDRPSQELAETSIAREATRFSFDDVAEPFTQWRSFLQKKKVAPLGTRGEFGLHFNFTGEYTGGRQQFEQTQIVLDSVIEKYPESRLALLHAYDDKRFIVRDSLAGLKEFESYFPFDEFRVVNTAKMSMDMDLHHGTFPGSAQTFALDFAIVSSYHTALLLHFLGVPAFLFSLNDYYRQKVAIFDLPADVSDFIADPRAFVRDFTPELSARDEWIAELTTVVASWDQGELTGSVPLTWPAVKRRTPPLFAFPGKYS